MTGGGVPPRNPSLLQVDARVKLRDLSDRLGRPATLDDVPDALLDGVAARGFDWIYLLGAWRTGDAGREISQSNPEWRAGYLAALPDVTDRDICGSCFAVTGYEAALASGGNPALLRFRDRLHRRGLRLMLDFVPNHVALDHPWVAIRPDLLLHGTAALSGEQPGNYVEREGAVFAHGRDPNYPGWPDTLQLDYANAATVAAMTEALAAAAGLCDGLRCDMAMLLLPEVFERTWGRPALPFWAEAIAAVRSRRADFVFAAEVYWGLEGRLLQLGFDLTYDKTLYDRLVAGDGGAVRAHLRAGAEEQHRMVRFLENHDEPRAASVFLWEKHQPAAVVTFCVPGLRFFHEGQFEGRQTKGSVHLDRIRAEPRDPSVAAFYERLLAALEDEVLRSGQWTLLEPRPAWDGNGTSDGFVVFRWDRERLGVVNLLPHQAQCYVRVEGFTGGRVGLTDLLGPARYERDGDDLAGGGMYFDLPGWGYHLFRMEALQG